MIDPDYSASLAFLRRWAPTGLWVLTAIQPTGARSITTETFDASTEAECLAWLKQYGGDRNVYFSVNPPRERIGKKAEREDIAELAWLHVDVDPRAGDDLGAEQSRILDLMTRKLPAGVPEPTCVVFSGGGYQAFWRLTDPIPLGGDLDKCEKAKLYNLQLEYLFQADSCHNVDRIMRLPGSINRPNERKIAKGRVPALARVVAFNDKAYPLAGFIPAAPVQSKTDKGFSGGVRAPQVSVSGNVKRLASLDELGPKVSDYTKKVIDVGYDPDNPKKHGSRSDWVWFVVCELVRSGVSDDVIFSLLTDPNYGICAHILDQDNPTSAALRQIARGREYGIHPKLAELNERHAVVEDYGGKCRIITEVIDGVIPNRTRLSFQSRNDFDLRYCNQKVEYQKADGSTASAPLGAWWLNNPHRRQYTTIVFAPEIDVPGAYNLWKGFAYKSRPGGSCAKLLHHIRENICSGNQEHFAYLVGWMANAVQHPASPGHTAIVLRGAQGTGKSFFAKAFGNLFGRHFLQVSDPKHLVGSFNAHLRDCVVLFGDEAFYAGDKKHESILKMLVTEEMITIEAKGVDATAYPNFVHLIMASNDDWVVPTGANERRFFVLDVKPTHQQDHRYFKDIQDELDNGGYEAFLHFLRTGELTAFDIRSLPRTRGLMDQRVLSFNGEQDWWYNKLLNGDILPGVGWPDDVVVSELTIDYVNHTRSFNVTFRGSATRLGMFIHKCMPDGHVLRGKRAGTHDVEIEPGRRRKVERPNVYLLPSLDECRASFDKTFGGPFPWPRGAVLPSATSERQEAF